MPRVEITDVDRAVGQKIRRYRILAGLTQHDLADRTGVTTQAVAKYEGGINRLSSGRLYRLAKALGQHPGDFFPE